MRVQGSTVLYELGLSIFLSVSEDSSGKVSTKIKPQGGEKDHRFHPRPTIEIQCNSTNTAAEASLISALRSCWSKLKIEM